MRAILSRPSLRLISLETKKHTKHPKRTPALNCAKFGPLLLAGDLYHLPEERTLDRVPTFDFDAAMTRATRKKTDEFVKQSGATLWIQHDPATNAPLKKAPQYYE